TRRTRSRAEEEARREGPPGLRPSESRRTGGPVLSLREAPRSPRLRGAFGLRASARAEGELRRADTLRPRGGTDGTDHPLRALAPDPARAPRGARDRARDRAAVPRRLAARERARRGR